MDSNGNDFPIKISNYYLLILNVLRLWPKKQELDIFRDKFKFQLFSSKQCLEIDI